VRRGQSRDVDEPFPNPREDQIVCMRKGQPGVHAWVLMPVPCRYRSDNYLSSPHQILRRADVQLTSVRLGRY
jgi:hypothetical protein